MRIQKPCSTSEVVAFSPGAIDSLWNSGQVTGSYSIAGVAKDGSFGWLAKGGALEVFNVKFEQRLAAWCFGAAIKDPETLITAVCEFENDRTGTTQLVVASTTLNSRTPGGLICLFDVHRSAVIKAVQVPYEVTSLETVAAVSPGSPLSRLLCEPVHSFCGTVAVGTQCGHLYLLDMCTDERSISNELTPKQVEVIDCSQPDVLTLRYQAISRNKHLCLELGDLTENDNLFTYVSTNGSVQCQMESSDVYISCLKFIKHTLTLLVGYTFGGFQLWNLRDPVLQYSSRWEADLPAVTHFAFQEPENDPKDYCYIWVVHGPTTSDLVKNTSSHMTLYQLCYQRKKWLEEFGFLYESLCSLAVRFNHELHLDPFNSICDPQCGSRVIACYTLENHQFKPTTVNANETLPDEEISPDRSLCLTVWEAVPLDEHVSRRCFLAIFDINRWYHAQLPSSLSCYRNQKALCPYWSVCALDEVIQSMSPDLLLMVHVDYNSLNRFVPPFIPLSEKFLYPSALAFNAYCISECGIVCSKFLGTQRLILGYIQKNGFSILLDPHEIYFACFKAGLLSTDSPAVKPTVACKRESLMSMALDYNVVGFVLACIEQLANAAFVAEGFTMRSILNWAWKKLSDCKKSFDELCVPLFDGSAAGLNEHDIRQLRYYQMLMSHMVTIFETLNDQSTATTDQGKEELATRLNIARLIAEYLDAIIWFHAVGLLPEHSEEEMLTEFQFAFPSKMLTAAYAARRQTIQQLNSNASSSGLLVIDALLEADGAAISQFFERECGVRLYPPTSFHALIGVFLLPDVALQTKLTLVLYLLRDLTFLADFERAKKMEDICKQLCSSFNISPSLYRHIYGLWLLDHQHFQQASDVLLDAGVCDDIPLWQHGNIIRAFLCQGHERLALKYMKVKAVPALTADDVKLRMTVLLANRLTAEALDYQRLHRDTNVIGDLMSHMILACLETNTIGELLNLPLTCEEENHLVKYLQNCGDASSQKLVVLYYLQQSHIIDAINTNGLQKLRGRPRDKEKLLEAVVEGYKKVLPSVQRKMSFCTETAHRVPSLRKEYARPTPLSSALHSHQVKQTVTRATLLNAVLDKVHELNIVDAPHSTDALPGSAEEHQPHCEETCVLFGTPIVPSSVKKSRISMFGNVIFPLSSTKDQTNLNFTRLLDSPMSFTNPVTQRLYSASALSLLQTPPVTRRRTIFAADFTQPPNPPQSILSMRHQKSNTETLVGPSSVAGMLTFSETNGSTPIIQSNFRQGIVSHQEADMVATPKLKTLRFMEPQDSPVTVAEQESVCPSQQEVEMLPIPNTSSNDEAVQSGEATSYADAAMDVEDEVGFNFKTPASPVNRDNRDESVHQSSAQLSSQSFVESSLPSAEVYLIHRNNPTPIIPETKRDEMEVDEVVEVLADGNLSDSPISDSLRRPPLWQSSLLPQSSAPKLLSISGSEEESGKAESEVLPITKDTSVQTSLSIDSEDVTVEKCSPGEEKSAVASLPLTPSRRSFRLQGKKDDANDNGGTGKSVSEKMDVSPSASEQLSRTKESCEQSSRLAASLLEPDASNDRSTPTRRSIRLTDREISKPSAEDSLQSEAKDVLVERPSTPTRRRSFRSPGRELPEKPSESVNDGTAVEQPSTPTRRRSIRSPSREVIEPSVELPNQTEDREVIVDHPSMSARRRSFRSPGREILDPLAEEAAQNESREIAIEEEGISTRRRSLRSASRHEVTDPSQKDSAESEHPSLSTRRRSFHSPSRDVAEPTTVQDSAKTERACFTSTRRRSGRSPSREVIEPSVEESNQSDDKEGMVDSASLSTRRKSLRSPSREIPDPANMESEDFEKRSMSTRRSLRSPSREVTEPSEKDFGGTVEQPSISSRRRSLRSPGREVPEFSVEEKILLGNGESEDVKTAGVPRQKSSVSPSREILKTSVLDDSSSAKSTSQQPMEEGQAATPSMRRFVRSPSRERVVFTDKLDESITPVRRSQRQKEKLEKAAEKDLGGMSAIQKSPEINKSRKTNSDQPDSDEPETGKCQTPRISKTLVLSLQEKRKPVTRSEAKRARERELLVLDGQAAGVSVTVSVHSKPRSPGRPAKHKAVEIDTQIDVTAAGHAPPSVASAAVASPSATSTASMEAVEEPAGPQFVFSAPALLDEKKDILFDVEDPVSHTSCYVFSPPHTRLRDRSAVEQRDVMPSATSSEMELGDGENADEEKVGKPGRRVKAAKSRGKKPHLAKTTSSDDAPILLSPISDGEPSPQSSTTNVKKRVMKSSRVTRAKRKKFGPSDPPIFW